MNNTSRFDWTKNETRYWCQQVRTVSISAFSEDNSGLWSYNMRRCDGTTSRDRYRHDIRLLARVPDDPPGRVIYTGGRGDISPGARAIPGTRPAGLRGGARPRNEIGPFDTVARHITRVADTDTGRRRRRCPRTPPGKRRQVYNKPKLLSFRHRRDDRVVF